MMYAIPRDVEIVVARNLREAIEYMSKLKDARVMAGGTDLIVDLKMGRFKPKYVVYIGGLQELKYIHDDGTSLRIGALTTIQEILDSRIVVTKTPLLKAVAEKFAYWQIRNAATIGGNICNASPAADMALPLLVHSALVKVESLEGSRLVNIRDFFKGPRQTALKPGEIVTEIIVPHGDMNGYSYAYFKAGRRLGHDLSLVAVACAVKTGGGVILDARIALNSVAPTPIRAVTVERTLIGKRASPEVIEEVSKLIVHDISPISDVRAPAEYRLHMAKLLTREALLEALGKPR
ncbi:MAG: xanthine dehydrogenase family protein subunit M [Desulfurococcaceae archaeon]|nr:xanthine dehydrogenase family protein subunit M [Desulfurococcaceae archaeon]